VCELCGEESNGTFICARCEPPSFFDEPREAESGPRDTTEAEAPEGGGAAQWQRQRKSPGLAAVLGVCFPTLGHLYLGQFTRAFVLFAILLGLIQLTQMSDIVALGILFFWVFQIFDAHRLANSINMSVVTGSRKGPPPPPPPKEPKVRVKVQVDREKEEPEPEKVSAAAEACCEATTRRRKRDHRLGGWILIIIGALFLLQNMGISVFNMAWRLWPLILIAIGLKMLWRYLDGNSNES
jgi:hypothetical protein